MSQQRFQRSFHRTFVADKQQQMLDFGGEDDKISLKVSQRGFSFFLTVFLDLLRRVKATTATKNAEKSI